MNIIVMEIGKDLDNKRRCQHKCIIKFLWKIAGIQFQEMILNRIML
jgi:hypothetical protein